MKEAKYLKCDSGFTWYNITRNLLLMMYEQSVRKDIEGIKQIDSIKGCEGEFPEQAGRIEALKLEDMGQDNCATSEGLGLTVAVQLYHVCLWVYWEPIACSNHPLYHKVQFTCLLQQRKDGWSENTFSTQRKDLIPSHS